MKSNNGRLMGSIIVMILIVIGSGLYFYYHTDQGEPLFIHKEPSKEEPQAAETEYQNVKFLTFKELQTKYQSGEHFVVVIVKTGCSFCKEFLPIYSEVLSDIDYQGYALDLINITSATERSQFNELFPIEGTPTTMIINNQQIVNTLVGTKEFEEFRIWLLAYWDQ